MIYIGNYEPKITLTSPTKSMNTNFNYLTLYDTCLGVLDPILIPQEKTRKRESGDKYLHKR